LKNYEYNFNQVLKTTGKLTLCYIYHSYNKPQLFIIKLKMTWFLLYSWHAKVIANNVSIIPNWFTALKQLN